MSEETISTEVLEKALSSLQDVIKGHNSRGTATTHVESMSGEGGSTQIHHTASNSDPGTWAGTGQRPVSENGATDGINEDGTDYSGSAEMVKSVLDKVAKGQELDEIEKAVLNAAVAKKDKKDDAEAEEKPAFMKGQDEDEDEVEKSLVDYAEENEDVAKGFEVSSFLSAWAAVQDEAQTASEDRISKSIRAAAEEQNTFNGQLAKSVAQLAEVLSIQAQRIEQLESSPARGPKSATAVEKSFGAGGTAPQGEELSKSQVSDALTELVQKGDIPALDAIRFDSTGELAPGLAEKVRAHYNR